MAFSTNGTSGNSRSCEINVTPLIDVLLVLLIIFMVIVPAVPHGLETELPLPKGATQPEATQPILVSVKQEADGVSYWVDGKSVARNSLRQRLAELLARQSAGTVLLKGDRALGFAALSGVIDAAYAGGARSVGLLTPGIAKE